MPTTENININSITELISPMDFKSKFSIPQETYNFVTEERKKISDILSGKSPRLLVVVGPCSIHNYDAAIEYAKKLKLLSTKVADKIHILMRIYFEKPRTTVGWKGYINDPNLDGSFNIEKGLKLARKLLVEINFMKLAAATEALDPITPQYLNDLISWSAIGARTTESQTHRELASGLSSPVGFKNGTDGDLNVAINALQSATAKHNFLGINEYGKVGVVSSKGNKDAHIVLRGGSKSPNYDSLCVAAATKALTKAKVNPSIMIDCSHANSGKDYRLQPMVFNNVLEQKIQGTKNIIGVMLESHLNEGNQPIQNDTSKLQYGISVTDACINFKTTQEIILKAHSKL